MSSDKLYTQADLDAAVAAVLEERLEVVSLFFEAWQAERDRLTALGPCGKHSMAEWVAREFGEHKEDCPHWIATLKKCVELPVSPAARQRLLQEGALLALAMAVKEAESKYPTVVLGQPEPCPVCDSRQRHAEEVKRLQGALPFLRQALTAIDLETWLDRSEKTRYAALVQLLGLEATTENLARVDGAVRALQTNAALKGGKD